MRNIKYECIVEFFKNLDDIWAEYGNSGHSGRLVISGVKNEPPVS